MIQDQIRTIQKELPSATRLVAVSKFHPAEAVRAAYDAGQRLFGESRPQELDAKARVLPADIEWHFIGHLQTNKLRLVLPHVSMVESADSLHLLEAMDRWCRAAGRTVDVLLELHLGAEETKQGFSADEIRALVLRKASDAAFLPSLRFRGLMGMATNTEDEARIDADFAFIEGLWREIRSACPALASFDQLSIGMSGDWRIALRHGATLVRIGTAIFGQRSTPGVPLGKALLLALALLLPFFAGAQSVTESVRSYRTYDFSDPDPIPRPDGIYPYFRYDGFSLDAREKDWKVVVLENDWLRVKILPEIGGKIWSVFDKKTGKEMFYDNEVVKFRDIALRGPWTSGGIEFNYGVIGHAPSCSHPVDYRTETKADGSVSCYIGVFELFTRTRWVVEINLPREAAQLRTRSFWHNGTGDFQPYYSWANSGVKVTDDLEIIYPARAAIGHDGAVIDYPVDRQGRDLSKYTAQAFGGSKSYHAVGSHKAYFGAFWPSEDFGVLHYALRDEKPGRKYFSWAQSPEGSIWTGLLSDSGVPYVELQSGRLFNQNRAGSEHTPFKQTVFSPYATDEWTEYWMPFHGLKRVDHVTDRTAVQAEVDSVRIYAARRLSGRLVFRAADGSVLREEQVECAPATVLCRACAGVARITLEGHCLWSSGTGRTERAIHAPEGYEADSVQGLLSQARYFVGIRRYAKALRCADAALAKDPFLLEALHIKALVALRRLDAAGSYAVSQRALAVDGYDAWANYLGGKAALALGKTVDAKDCFELAALTGELRGAACTALARIYLKEGDRELAGDYLRKALSCNAGNLTAYQLLYQAAPSEPVLEAIAGLDPLSHFPEMERMLSGRLSAAELAASIQEEMRWQDYLEAAVFYASVALEDKALRILEACPEQNVLTCLWTAWLKRDASLIAPAEQAPHSFVFPFRSESAAVLEWARQNGGGWVSAYLSALLYDSVGDKERARALLEGVESPESVFYSYRASLTGALPDLEKALALAPDSWRCVQDLALRHYRDGHADRALAVVEPCYLRHRDNVRLGDTYVKALIACGQYAKAEKALDAMVILPFEGQAATRIMYRDIKLHLAAERIDRRQYGAARRKLDEARQWPEHLGVGKPYDDRVDTGLEDVLTAVVCARTGKAAEAREWLRKAVVAQPDKDWNGFYEKACRGKVSPLVGSFDSTQDKRLF